MGFFSKIHRSLNPMNYVGGKVGKEYQNLQSRIDPFAPDLRGDPAETARTSQMLEDYKNPPEMGAPRAGWSQPAPVTPPAQPQIPMRDMSGESGNPFARRAGQLGFTDYQPARQAPNMSRQRAQAQALRGAANG